MLLALSWLGTTIVEDSRTVRVVKMSLLFQTQRDILMCYPEKAIILHDHTTNTTCRKDHNPYPVTDATPVQWESFILFCHNKDRPPMRGKAECVCAGVPGIRRSHLFGILERIMGKYLFITLVKFSLGRLMGYQVLSTWSSVMSL